MEEKKNFWQQEEDLEGFGQAFVVSEERKLNWVDIETLEAYSFELKTLAIKILHLMAKALGMDATDMELFEEGSQSMRMNYYPPCPQPELVIGLNPHTDPIVTNGIYRSIEHRATVNSEKERVSIATFYNPKLDGDMGPAPSLVTPERPALFKRIGVADYFEGLFTRELHGKPNLEAMRIQNEDEKSI
ncbi:Protein SRG1 [Morella rubra]|uniref:Protein SRG1 n=1 Tax=Morella rubra TaxID=262757 RepID=A0A6A1V7D5_9ROSI|nr:Protein SRG1 [Morella rubra]